RRLRRRSGALHQRPSGRNRPVMLRLSGRGRFGYKPGLLPGHTPSRSRPAGIAGKMFDSASPVAARRMTTGLLLIMAIAAGVSVANLYYNQPMLGLIAHDLGTAIPVGLVAMATQLGYALGLVLLVP